MRDLVSRFSPLFLYAGLFSLVINLLPLVPPLYMLQVFDRVLASRSGETLAMLTVMAVGALVVMAMLDVLRARLLSGVGMVLDRTLGPRVLDGVLAHTAKQSGTAYVNGLRDVNTLRAFLGGTGLLTLFDAPWLPFFLLVIFLFHPLLGATALTGALALPGAARAQELPDTPESVVIPPVVWVLTSFPGVGAIASPELYTVQFVPDGTINARAEGIEQRFELVARAADPAPRARAFRRRWSRGRHARGSDRPAARTRTQPLRRRRRAPTPPRRKTPARRRSADVAAPVTTRTGWIIQVGALESEGEARQRIDLCRNKASSLLSKADPFTEPVVAKDNKTLYRARFAGLERDQAEAACRTLKRADISCITVRN